METDSQNFQEKIYFEVAKRSSLIIPYFKFLYLAILIVSLGFGSYFELTQGPYFQFFYEIGKNFGRAAILLLGFVVLPGILGRFGIEIRITRIITIFRRQLGILVFILSFSHYHLVRGLGRLTGLSPISLPWPTFEYFGFLAFILLLFMFLTSNNWSVKKLGRLWKKLHRIVYVVLWLLVLHTGLQQISVWSVYIFAFAALEISSLVFDFYKRRNAKL